MSVSMYLINEQDSNNPKTIEKYKLQSGMTTKAFQCIATFF